MEKGTEERKGEERRKLRERRPYQSPKNPHAGTGGEGGGRGRSIPFVAPTPFYLALPAEDGNPEEHGYGLGICRSSLGCSLSPSWKEEVLFRRQPFPVPLLTKVVDLTVMPSQKPYWPRHPVPEIPSIFPAI